MANFFAKKTILVFLLLLSSAIFAHQFGQKEMKSIVLPEGELGMVIPTEFAGWTIDATQPVVIANPEQEATLKQIYSDILSRTYVNQSGDRVMLSLAYGRNQSEGLQVHFPEVCYNAQGFKVGKVQDAAVDVRGTNIPVRKLLAVAGARQEPITYWVIVGNRIANTAIEQKYVLLEYGTKRVTPDGLLFRISSIGADQAEQYELQQKFLNDLFGAMSPGPQARLLGNNRI